MMNKYQLLDELHNLKKFLLSNKADDPSWIEKREAFIAEINEVIDQAGFLKSLHSEIPKDLMERFGRLNKEISFYENLLLVDELHNLKNFLLSNKADDPSWIENREAFIAEIDEILDKVDLLKSSHTLIPEYLMETFGRLNKEISFYEDLLLVKEKQDYQLVQVDLMALILEMSDQLKMAAKSSSAKSLQNRIKELQRLPQFQVTTGTIIEKAKELEKFTISAHDSIIELANMFSKIKVSNQVSLLETDRVKEARVCSEMDIPNCLTQKQELQSALLELASQAKTVAPVAPVVASQNWIQRADKKFKGIFSSSKQEAMSVDPITDRVNLAVASLEVAIQNQINIEIEAVDRLYALLQSIEPEPTMALIKKEFDDLCKAPVTYQPNLLDYSYKKLVSVLSYKTRLHKAMLQNKINAIEFHNHLFEKEKTLYERRFNLADACLCNEVLSKLREFLTINSGDSIGLADYYKTVVNQYNTLMVNEIPKLEQLIQHHKDAEIVAVDCLTSSGILDTGNKDRLFANNSQLLVNLAAYVELQKRTIGSNHIADMLDYACIENPDYTVKVKKVLEMSDRISWSKESAEFAINKQAKSKGLEAVLKELKVALSPLSLATDPLGILCKQINKQLKSLVVGSDLCLNQAYVEGVRQCLISMSVPGVYPGFERNEDIIQINKKLLFIDNLTVLSRPELFRSMDNPKVRNLVEKLVTHGLTLNDKCTEENGVGGRSIKTDVIEAFNIIDKLKEHANLDEKLIVSKLASSEVLCKSLVKLEQSTFFKDKLSSAASIIYAVLNDKLNRDKASTVFAQLRLNSTQELDSFLLNNNFNDKMTLVKAAIKSLGIDSVDTMEAYLQSIDKAMGDSSSLFNQYKEKQIDEKSMFQFIAHVIKDTSSEREKVILAFNSVIEVQPQYCTPGFMLLLERSRALQRIFTEYKDLVDISHLTPFLVPLLESHESLHKQMNDPRSYVRYAPVDKLLQENEQAINALLSRLVYLREECNFSRDIALVNPRQARQQSRIIDNFIRSSEAMRELNDFIRTPDEMHVRKTGAITSVKVVMSSEEREKLRDYRKASIPILLDNQCDLLANKEQVAENLKAVAQDKLSTLWEKIVDWFMNLNPDVFKTAASDRRDSFFAHTVVQTNKHLGLGERSPKL